MRMLCSWKEQADKLSAEEISKEDYDQCDMYFSNAFEEWAFAGT